MRILRFAPAICWFLLSFFLLTLPGNRLPKFPWFEAIHGDKFAHIGMFSVLVILFQLAVKNIPAYKLLPTALTIGISALAYGTIMEFVQQYFVEGRSFELADIAADAVGSFLPYLALVLRIKSVNDTN